MCEKCLYKDNCQFLATHKKSIVADCTAYKSEADLRAEVAREIFEEIEFDIHQLMFDRDETRAIAIEGIIANLKKKYTEGKK